MNDTTFLGTKPIKRRSLAVERLDLVNLRSIEQGGEMVPLAEQLGVLEDMRQEGKIELIGISSVGIETVRQALELVAIASVQNSYSIMFRDDDPIVELCREHEIAFVPFFPLGSAFTGGPAALAGEPAISEVAKRHGATPSQVALAWLLARYDRMLLIPGTASIRHLEEHLAAIGIALDEDDLATLEAVESRGDPLASVA